MQFVARGNLAAGGDLGGESGHRVERMADAPSRRAGAHVGGLVWGGVTEEDEDLLGDEFMTRRLELPEAVEQDISVRKDTGKPA